MSHLEVAVLDVLGTTCGEAITREGIDMRGCQTPDGTTFMVDVPGPDGQLVAAELQGALLTWNLLLPPSGSEQARVVAGAGWAVTFLGADEQTVSSVHDQLGGLAVLRDSDDIDAYLDQLIALGRRGRISVQDGP